MLRVLHVVGGLSRGGTESALMNIYREIDKSVIQLDIISHHPELNAYEQEFKESGGKIYYIPAFKGTNIIQYIYSWSKFFREHPEYKIIHSHVWSTAAIFLPIAKRCGLYTIMHAHSVSARTGIQALGRQILKQPLKYCADYYMACSEKAARWTFGNRIFQRMNFRIIPNAIDPEKYRYNRSLREELRYKYNVDGKVVMGHVGTFDYNKNQDFILDVFQSVHRCDNNTVLWLVGDGENVRSVNRKVSDMGLSDAVIFWGIRDDVHELLQAMDIFLFPSGFESFGSAALEAQAAGLPVICSAGVPKDVAVSDRISFLPVSRKDEWIDRILELVNTNNEHTDMFETIKGTKYDIAMVVKWLQQFYLEKVE